MRNKIIFIQSHPIQYFAPFYAKICSQNIDCNVIYCSKEGLDETFDVQFGTKIKWDIPLLEGYESKFIKNNSFKPSINNGFFGLLNLVIIKEIKNTQKSLIVVPGWNYASYWLAIFAAKFYGHKVALRGESPYNQEIIKPKLILFFKKLLLGKFLFKLIDHFFYIGNQNKNFYKYYGVHNSKLLFVPYSVDNNRFRESSLYYYDKKTFLRNSLGIGIDKKVILFSGKYISKKRPLDLLRAFKEISTENVHLIMMGDGDLRQEMIEYIDRNDLNNKVLLTGFINQSEIVQYYSLSDIFVMCSGDGETWGLSVNEAMNFGLKLIISKKTGCSIDLVIEGITGWSFETGNVEDLHNKLKLAINDNKINRKNILKKIDDFSYDVGIKNITNNLFI